MCGVYEQQKKQKETRSGKRSDRIQLRNYKKQVSTPDCMQSE